MHVFNLKTGDTSGDGHNIEKSTLVSCSHSVDEVVAAFRAGVSVVGVDITLLCADYEEDYIQSDAYEILKSHGFELPDWDENEEVFCIDDKTYCYIYMKTAKIGWAIKQIRPMAFSFPEVDYIRIGGYGLYSG